MKKILFSVFLAISTLFTINAVPVYATNSSQVALEEYNYSTGETSTIYLNVSDEFTYSPAYTPTPSASAFNLPSEISPNSIISGSTLSKVSNTTVAPYCKVILMRNGFDTTGDGKIDTWTTSTGFMVKKGVMLTACHTMYHTKEHIWAKRVELYLKHNGNSTSYINATSYNPISWVYNANYTNDTSTCGNDWCVVKTSTEIGNATGYFGYKTATSSNVNTNVEVSGYPETYKYYQYHSSNGSIQSVDTNNNLVYYSASALGGMSGAPVFDANYYVYAIHGYGTSDTVVYNSGALIDSTIISAINNYNN